MPIKPATETSLKRVAVRPAVTSASSLPRRQAGNTEPNSSSVLPARQPVPQRASALPKRTATGKPTTHSRQNSETDPKSPPSATGTPEVGQLFANEVAAQNDTENVQTPISVNESGGEQPDVPDACARPVGASAPKADVTNRQSLVATRQSEQLTRKFSANLTSVAHSPTASTAGARRGSNATHDDLSSSAPSNTLKASMRVSKLRAPSSTVRSSLQPAAKSGTEREPDTKPGTEREAAVTSPIECNSTNMSLGTEIDATDARPGIEADATSTSPSTDCDMVLSNECDAASASPGTEQDSTRTGLTSNDSPPSGHDPPECRPTDADEPSKVPPQLDWQSAPATECGSAASNTNSPSSAADSIPAGVQAELERVLTENAQLSASNLALTTQLSQRDEQLHQMIQTVAELRAELVQRDCDSQERRREFAQIDAMKNELTHALDNSRVQVEGMSRLVEALRADRAALVRKFDVLGVVAGVLQRRADQLERRCTQAEQSSQFLDALVKEREESVQQLTRQLSTVAQQHAVELESSRRQFDEELTALEKRLTQQHDETLQQLNEQHNEEVCTLRACHDQQLVLTHAAHRKALEDAEANHARQLSELARCDEQHLNELELAHRRKTQELEAGFASIKALYEDRIESLQADCNDLRHRVQLYDQTVQKQCTVRCQIESASALAPVSVPMLLEPVSSLAKRSDSSGSSVSSSADSLTATYAARAPSNYSFLLAREHDTSRLRCQSVSRSPRDNAIVSHAHLEQEIASLNAVIELRNSEIRDLRKQQADMQSVQADFADARAKIRELQMHIENLDALLAIKTDSEKALTEKHNMLLRKFEKEAKASKRLSMDYEEARFRLEQLEDAARMRAEGELSPRVAAGTAQLASSLPIQSPMTISCPNHAAVFGSTKHRHGSSSSSATVSLSPQARSSVLRSSRASSGSRPRSYHAGQSFIPAPSSGVTMRKSRAGTAPPDRGADYTHSLFGSPQHGGAGLLRAVTPGSEAWMIPLREKAEESGSSNSIANSSANVSTSASIVLREDADGESTSSKQRELTPETLNSPVCASANDQLNPDDANSGLHDSNDAILEHDEER